MSSSLFKFKEFSGLFLKFYGTKNLKKDTEFKLQKIVKLLLNHKISLRNDISEMLEISVLFPERKTDLTSCIIKFSNFLISIKKYLIFFKE